MNRFEIAVDESRRGSIDLQFMIWIGAKEDLSGYILQSGDIMFEKINSGK